MTAEGRDDLHESVREAAAATQGPEFEARINDGCAHCPVRAICPARAAIGGAPVVTARYSPVELADALGVFAPTDEQAAVIAAPPGPLVVIAGAGAGKTETMAARVVWLVANGHARPGEVLGLTFTRKAAGQLLRRVRTRLARLAGAVSCRAGRATRSTSTHGGHLSRLRRDPPARARSAAADGACHPIDQRDRALAVGVPRGVRAPGPLDTEKSPAAITAMVLRLAGQLADHLVDTDLLRDTHLELERLVHTLPAGPRQRDRGPTSRF